MPPRLPSKPSKRKQEELTAEQRQMYGAEKLMNFRTIAKLCATRSRRTLTAEDLAPTELKTELSQIGQFAEMAYSKMPGYIFEHLEELSRDGFPLEGYDTLASATLVSKFQGKAAALPGFAAYRAETKQLVVAVSGTATVRQALYDVHFRKRRHPAGRGCAVHAGFWKLYKGIKAAALEAIRKGIGENEVEELVLTGHSLGGAVSFLLALDLLASEESTLLSEIDVTIMAFGAPRVGNAALARVWRDAVRSRREKKGERAVREYLVKAHNDGCPALPPATLGYRHFTAVPLYFYHDVLFNVPASESEHGIFNVSGDALNAAKSPQYPRGGHNYYNSRDLERFFRRMGWAEELLQKGGNEWEAEYLARCTRVERGRTKQVGS